MSAVIFDSFDRLQAGYDKAKQVFAATAVTLLALSTLAEKVQGDADTCYDRANAISDTEDNWRYLDGATMGIRLGATCVHDVLANGLNIVTADTEGFLHGENKGRLPHGVNNNGEMAPTYSSNDFEHQHTFNLQENLNFTKDDLSNFAPDTTYAGFFNEFSGTEKIVPQYIVWHWMGGRTNNSPVDAARAAMNRPDNKVSYQFSINRDGTASLMTATPDTLAWHARTVLNRVSIGIETEATGYEDMSAEQVETLIKLTYWLAENYDIPLDRDHVIGHSEGARFDPSYIDDPKIDPPPELLDMSMAALYEVLYGSNVEDVKSEKMQRVVDGITPYTPRTLDEAIQAYKDYGWDQIDKRFGAKMTIEDYVRLSYFGGYRGYDVVIMAAVAYAESTGRPGAIGDYGYGVADSISAGATQIRFSNILGLNDSYRNPETNLNPFNAFKNAHTIQSTFFDKGGNLVNDSHWTQFNNNNYRVYIPDAESAFASVESEVGSLAE